MVVPSFLQETEEVFEAGCSFHLSQQFLIRVKDIWKGPSRGAVSDELIAFLGEQEQSRQNPIRVPNISRGAGKSIWGPQNDPHSTFHPLSFTWGNCWGSKITSQQSFQFLQGVSSNFSQGKTQTPGVFNSDHFPSLFVGRKAPLGTDTPAPPSSN